MRFLHGYIVISPGVPIDPLLRTESQRLNVKGRAAPRGIHPLLQLLAHKK